ncbi:MAG TPA: thioredoxin-like domain-containing protein [Phycisphaerae bacterium]|nr:thioredoxin-like domain-containing protein [Phycisphaerae bacterium]
MVKRQSWRVVLLAGVMSALCASVARAADFSGQVVDEEGRGVGGACVMVGAPGGKWVLADKEGRWRFTSDAPPPADAKAMLPVYAYAPDVDLPAVVRPEEVPVPDLQAGRAVLRLSHGQPVTLTVRDGAGKPVAGAAVAVVGPGEPAAGGVRPGAVPLGQDGATIGLERGEDQLLVRAKGYAPRVVQVPVNGPMRVAVVVGPGVPLVARIEDDRGKAIAGATLRPVRWTGVQEPLDLGVSLTSGPDGSVEWDDAPAAAVRADVTAPGFLSRQDVEITPRTDNHVTLVRQAPILLRLQQAGGAGGEITGLSITRGVVDGKHTTWDPRPLPAASLHADNSGALSYTETQAHESLIFRVAGADVQPSQTHPIPLDGKEHEVAVMLARGARIGGTLTDAQGNPAANVLVRLVDTGDSPSPAESARAEFTQLLSPDAQRQHPADFARTDPAGRFAFSPRAADVLLLAQGDGGYLCARIKPDAGLTTYTLTPWAEIDGTLHQGSRLAAANTWVTARGSSGQGLPSFQGAGRTDAKGYFRIPHMIAGSAIVTGPGAPAENVQLQPGKRVIVTLGGGGRTVIGKLADASKTTGEAIVEHIVPLPVVTLPPDFRMSTNSQREAFYTAWRQSSAGSAFLAADASAAAHHDHAVVSNDGAFRIEGIKPGDYRLRRGETEYLLKVPPPTQGAADQPLDLGTLNPQPAYTDLLGQTAPDFLLVRFDGKPETLSSLWQPRPAGDGDILLLEFWASTSAASQTQEAPLKKIFDTLGPAGGRSSRLQIVSLSTDQQETTARKYVEAHAMPWTHAWIGPLGGAHAFAAQIYQVRELPTFVLIDSQGKVAAISHHAATIAPAVQQALAAP